jgi:hypothetical protein
MTAKNSIFSLWRPQSSAPFRRLSAVVYYVGWKRHLQFTDHCCFRHELRKNMQTIASGSHVGFAQKGASHTRAVRQKQHARPTEDGVHTRVDEGLAQFSAAHWNALWCDMLFIENGLLNQKMNMEYYAT